MLRIRYIAFATAMLVFGTAYSDAPTRIDATSYASAEASWNKMLMESDSDTQNKLRGALIQLIGTSGLSGLRLHTAMEDPSPGMVKDRIAGLNAAQIIELGRQVSVVK
jgi:hypothetical protein